ncbi:MAG: hypothetical protein DMG19_04850 [Acidobacteria bacterium]|nr:MAG: hypothetical protein DMG19_04850 [Acidobacteriota bacterium]
MNKQMIIAGLKARPVRTTVSLLAVALEVVLILVVVGLTSGISDETGRRTEGVGADILLQPPNSSLFLALSNTTMPIVLRERLRELPGIKAITPVQTLVNSSAGLEIIYGIEPDTFDAVSNGFIWHKGRLFNAPDEVVVDDIYAKAKGVTVGDTVELVNHKFKVCGIVEHGKGARLFISLKMAQEMTSRRNRHCGNQAASRGVWRDSSSGIRQVDDVEQHAGVGRIYFERGVYCIVHRSPGDFPFDVHDNHRAYPRNRYSAILRRFQDVHRYFDFRGVGCCLLGRRPDRNRIQFPDCQNHNGGVSDTDDLDYTGLDNKGSDIRSP